MKSHWTERSVKDFLFSITSDFVAQLAKKMEAEKTSQNKFARKLGLTKGRVSQIINNPGNISLLKAIEYARALGMKISLVAYEDNDPENKKGPINSEIFKICWEKASKPRDFWAFEEMNKEMTVANTISPRLYMDWHNVTQLSNFALKYLGSKRVYTCVDEKAITDKTQNINFQLPAASYGVAHSINLPLR